MRASVGERHLHPVARPSERAQAQADAGRWLDEGGSLGAEAGDPVSATAVIPEASRERAGAAMYSCPACGHRLQLYGGGRHRVYFELDDARLSAPVMDAVCPACGQRLPGRNPPHDATVA
jgi:predicted RNA-binding Zn-ribbon protein involved in translation (DUF1610 family)